MAQLRTLGDPMISTANTRPLSKNGEGATFIAVFLLLIPLAYSDEIVDVPLDAFSVEGWRWTLVALDAVLLALVLQCKRVIRLHLNHPPRVRIFLWWLSGAALTLGLDVMVTIQWQGVGVRMGPDLVASILYTISLTLLIAATVDASPLVLVRQFRAKRSDEWMRLRVAIPLLIGTLAAYVGSTIWAHGLNRHATRVLAPLDQNHVKEFTLPEQQNLLATMCSGAVDQEYFAQVSQVIPLLLVALGVEAGFFWRLMRAPAHRAMTITTVFVLCIGEVLALSALPKSGKGCGDVLHGWHEHIAFVFTLEACFIALATLVWVLVVRPAPENEDGVPPA